MPPKESVTRNPVEWKNIRVGMIVSTPPHEHLMRVTSLEQEDWRLTREGQGALLRPSGKPLRLQATSGGWGEATVGIFERVSYFENILPKKTKKK